MNVVKQRFINANPKLPLPDGRIADDLRVNELYRVLDDLGVPGINVTMGKLELLQTYDASPFSKEAAARAASHKSF